MPILRDQTRLGKGMGMVSTHDQMGTLEGGECFPKQPVQGSGPQPPLQLVDPRERSLPLTSQEKRGQTVSLCLQAG